MMEETKMTEKESMELITSMINKVKRDYHETGISALLWGSIILLCSLVTFGNAWWQIDWLNYIWFLTIIAIVPQIIISISESKRKKFKTYSDEAISSIWISFGIAVMLISVYASIYKTDNQVMLYLIMYGVPTFATGLSVKFVPMIIGGIACWILSIASIFVSFPYIMLLSAFAALIAWLIPGLILRKRYVAAIKRGNV